MVFWPNMGKTVGGFSLQIWKNDMRAPCFWENGGFSTKYGHESSVFFREWTFFWQNMGTRAVIFLEKSEIKGHPIEFFGPIQTSRKNAWYYRQVLRKNHPLSGGGSIMGLTVEKCSIPEQNCSRLSAKIVEIMFDIISALWEKKNQFWGFFYMYLRRSRRYTICRFSYVRLLQEVRSLTARVPFDSLIFY